jgi:hypothetical protein
MPFEEDHRKQPPNPLTLRILAVSAGFSAYPVFENLVKSLKSRKNGMAS